MKLGAVTDQFLQIYNGGSSWADYWAQMSTELRNNLISSGKVNEALMDTFLAHGGDSTWRTQTIAFTAVYGRAPNLSADA